MLLLGALAPTAVRGATHDAVHVLRISPGAGTTDVPRNTPVVIFFDRPIVPLTAIEHPSAAPARLDPPLAGSGRWINTATWAWFPDGSLHGATRYTATVPAGLRAVDGALTDAPFHASFTTVLPAVARVTPADRTLYADFRAPISVRFNQNVDRAAAASALTLRDDAGRRVAGTVSWPRADTLLFHPARWLTPGHSYSAVVDRSLRSTEGLLAPAGNTGWQFTTAGIPTVLSTSPANGDRAADMSRGLEIDLSAPVAPRLVSKHLRLIPHLPNISVSASQDGTTLTIFGSWAPSTHYRLALDGIVGTYGQALAHPLRMGFITAALPPTVQFGYANSIVTFDAYRPVDVVMNAINTPSLNLTLYRISRQEFVNLFSENMNLYTPTEAPLYRRHRTVVAPLDRSVAVGQDLAEPDGRPLAPGFYFVSASGLNSSGDGSQPASLAFMLTRSAVTLKSSPGRTLVWATDLRSGQPIPHVLVSVVRQDNNGLVVAGHTGTDGVLDVASGRVSSQSYGLFALVDRLGDAALASSIWNSGVGAYDFNVPSSYGANGHQGYLYTDRPIYRPGQRVRFRGVLRRDDDGAYSLLTSSTPVRVTMSDATGHMLYDRMVRLDSFGAIAGSFTLGADAPLGWNTLNAQAGNDSFSVQLQIAAYRKPDFTVSAASAQPGGNVTSGQPARVTVSARYLFDAPLNGARVHWSVLSSDLYFSAPAYPDFTFQDYPFIPFMDYALPQAARPDGYPVAANRYVGYSDVGYGPCYGCNGANGQPLVAQGDAHTDAAGNLTLSIPADLRRINLSQQWSVEADVTDINNSSVSGRTTIAVHKGLIYVGLRGPSALVVAGQPARLDLLTIGQDGVTLAPNVPVGIALYRRTYRPVFTANAWWPQWQPVDTLLRRYNAATGINARGAISVTVPSAGEFRVVATAMDARGNRVRSAILLYAAGPDEAASPWANAPQDRITLIPDRHLYRIGDVAHLLVAAPRPNMTALVTIERGRVYSHRMLRLSGSSPILSVPILPSYLPDVFVSVVLVAGTGPHADAPLWKMGVAELPVDVRARRLTLTLRADAARAHPGQRVTLRLHVADAAGRPVRGQFSLAVVDKAVLTLAPELASPILDAFYAERGLGVQTAYSQNAAAFQLPTSAATLSVAQRERHAANSVAFAPGRGGGGGGAGGGGPAATPRAYFPDTAYWNPGVVTDADGNAAVTVTLPDSLTTWQIAARGVTPDTNVGQTSMEIVSTRDLLLRPVLPRFFTLNDRAEVGAVVNNTTAHAVTARIALTASPDAGAPSMHGVTVVSVPAGSERLVTWPLQPAALGSEHLLLAVTGAGVGGDSVLVAAPVQPNSTPEVVATSGEVGLSRVERVVVPSGAQSGEGGLTLTLQPSLAAGLRSSVDYLQQYPWESNEDIAARVMGETALLRLPATATSLSATTLAAYRRDVRDSIRLLLEAQRGDGGWGWWSDDPWSSPTVSAFCLDALGVARRAGFTIGANTFITGDSYLTGQAQSVATSPLDASVGAGVVTPDLVAYIAYVLDATGASGGATALFAARDGLPLWSRAYLLRALRLENGGMLGPRARTVLAELEAAAHLDATGAHWESAGSDASMDDPVHATAVVLDALIEADPHSPLIAPATRWLVAARGAEVWPTTVDNAVVLRTLSDELRGSGELRGRYTFAAALGGHAWGSGSVQPATLGQPRVLASGPLGTSLVSNSAVPVHITRSNRTGRLYYTLRLAYYPRVDRVAALSRGVSIARQYIYNGHAVTAAPVGAMVQVRLTVTSVQDLYYAAIEDPLPAGAEAVDPTLLTTSQLQTGGYKVPPHTTDLAWYANHTELRDDRAAVFATYLPAGVYRYEYTIHLTTRGTFHALPPHIQESYFPEVFGRGSGGYFTVQ